MYGALNFHKQIMDIAQERLPNAYSQKPGAKKASTHFDRLMERKAAPTSAAQQQPFKALSRKALLRSALFSDSRRSMAVSFIARARHQEEERVVKAFEIQQLQVCRTPALSRVIVVVIILL